MMKQCDKIQKALQAHYKIALVHDAKGDGHFVQVVCVDDLFSGVSLLNRTRAINQIIMPWHNLVHAWSVKGFTEAEWALKQDGFEYQQYKHYPKS
jgi:acid stress-induced BolA-like protein IbaG/YrbA